MCAYRLCVVRRVRYYAMVAEWDAMVGQYMSTVKELGIWNQTVFIVTRSCDAIVILRA